MAKTFAASRYSDARQDIPQALPLMSQRDDQPLRNYLYAQQSHSSRNLSRSRRALYRVIVPLGYALIRLVWGWSRVVHVQGEEHILRAIERSSSFIPVYWHQHQLFCIKQLLAMRASGVKLSFLISPSVDGEIGAMLVKRIGASVIRGSSSHTGARALRDYYVGLVEQNLSSAITPDGPRGPPWKFKPGAVLLSQLSQRPIVPMAYAASHAWRIKWDKFVIPWPFARIAIAIGEPVYIKKGLDAAALAEAQVLMEARMKNLFETARLALVRS
jgi:lysophospholipid acyltransferase (LPLAT)-like uncharacterized protein